MACPIIFNGRFRIFDDRQHFMYQKCLQLFRSPNFSFTIKLFKVFKEISFFYKVLVPKLLFKFNFNLIETGVSFKNFSAGHHIKQD